MLDSNQMFEKSSGDTPDFFVVVARFSKSWDLDTRRSENSALFSRKIVSQSKVMQIYILHINDLFMITNVKHLESD